MPQNGRSVQQHIQIQRLLPNRLPTNSQPIRPRSTREWGTSRNAIPRIVKAAGRNFVEPWGWRAAIAIVEIYPVVIERPIADAAIAAIQVGAIQRSAIPKVAPTADVVVMHAGAENMQNCR